METLYYFSEESLNAHFKNVMNSNQNNNKKNKNIEEELNIYDFTDVLCKNNDNKKTYIDNMLTNIFTLEKLITAYPLASQLEPRLNLVDFEDFFYNLTPYSNLKLKGEFTTLEAVTDVVAPNFDPAYQPKTDPNNPVRFGAKDVHDLNWKNEFQKMSL